VSKMYSEDEVELERRYAIKDYLSEQGRKGGKMSSHRPMKDPNYARKLAKLSAQRRREKRQRTQLKNSS
jgi:hypothetical protein